MFSKRTDWQLSLNLFTKAQRELEKEGREVLDLTLSNPTRAGIPYDERSILGSLNDPRALDYDPQSKGLLSARKAVTRYYSDQHPGLQLDPESVILTTSTSEGYSYVFRLMCNPGDEVLVPKPSYPLFDFLADLQDVKLVPSPLIYDHGWHIDIPSLQRVISPRTCAIVLVHPNNPTGSYVSSTDRAALNELCKQHNLALIVDEVFLDYRHSGDMRQTFASNGEALTFTLSGLSKISALPQMKVAWVVVSGPKQMTSPALERLEVIADTFLSMNTPIQLALPALLEQRKRIQPFLLDRVRENLAELDSQLMQQQTCQRLDVEGGWYAILRIPVLQSDEESAIQILHEQSVLVHPGHFVDFPRDGYLVLSLITRPEEFREGTRRILQSLNG